MLEKEDEEWLNTTEHNGTIYTERVKDKLIEMNNQLNKLNVKSIKLFQALTEALKQLQAKDNQILELQKYLKMLSLANDEFKKQLEQQKQEFEKQLQAKDKEIQELKEEIEELKKDPDENDDPYKDWGEDE